MSYLTIASERTFGDVPGTHFGRTSAVGAINQNKDFFAGFAFKGYMNADLFEGWLECAFAPSLTNPKKISIDYRQCKPSPKRQNRSRC